jgi:hypothetical protein
MKKDYVLLAALVLSVLLLRFDGDMSGADGESL